MDIRVSYTMMREPNENSVELTDANEAGQQLKLERLVAQHNDLIRARYDMSLVEARLFVALLGRINRGDKEFVLCRIPVGELYPDEKVGGKTYTQVKKAVMRLVSRVITIETTDERGMREFVSNPLMATCRYKEGSGYVVAQFNNFVKPYLLELKGDFTVAEQLMLLGFRSFYSHRLYWLLKSSAFYQDNIRMDLLMLKQTLNLNERYANFADFKRFVLEIAQQEIANTDMAFEYSPLKEGRAITGVLFHLLRPAVLTSEDTELPDGVQQQLTEIGVTLKSLLDIKSRYKQGSLTEEYIRFVLEYYKQANAKGKVRSLGGAIYKALTTEQLMQEFQHWKAEVPVYKAPKSKPFVETRREKVLSMDELRRGYAIMNTNSLTNQISFDESLALYYGDYRIEIRNGQEVLIYLDAENS